LFVICAACVEAGYAAEGRYLAAVHTFADNVLKYGRDVYGPEHTPLLVDGINVDTHEPAVWDLPEDCARVWKMPRHSVLSNLASQQNLFRTLDALTAITGDNRYHQAAVDAVQFGFDRLLYKNGLLFWGGHCAVDLTTGQTFGESHKDWTKGVPIPADWDTGLAHELKHHFPYYELMWQVNADRTREFVDAYWFTHVLNWANLDMNRHGIYGRGAGPGWDHAYEGGPVPFAGKGLTVMHGGSDMIYAAGMITLLGGDDRPLTWAQRMVQRYTEIRHPVTKLAPDLYGYYRNERTLAQFGPEWGGRINEASIVSIYGSRYGQGALGLMKLAERLGNRGEFLRRFVVEDLTAYARQAYDPADNSFWAMLTDGTRLSPDMVKRPGPVTPSLFAKHGAGSTHLWVYSLAARASGEPVLRETVQHIGRAMNLGDLGDVMSLDAVPPQLNLQTDNADPFCVFALLDLYKQTQRREYLDLARRIGDNLLARQFHRGFFVPDDNHVFCKFDTSAPLALLHLDAALSGWKVQLPFYPGGHSYFHCDFEGHGRSYDGDEIYNRTRSSVSQPAAARDVSE
jgi:pectate lyase